MNPDGLGISSGRTIMRERLDGSSALTLVFSAPSFSSRLVDKERYNIASCISEDGV